MSFIFVCVLFNNMIKIFFIKLYHKLFIPDIDNLLISFQNVWIFYLPFQICLCTRLFLSEIYPFSFIKYIEKFDHNSQRN